MLVLAMDLSDLSAVLPEQFIFGVILTFETDVDGERIWYLGPGVFWQLIEQTRDKHLTSVSVSFTRKVRDRELFCLAQT